MRRSLDRVYQGLMALAAVALVAAFMAVMLSMADRQFGLGLRGLDAYAGYAIAAALFLALPGTLQNSDHIRVSLVLERLGPAARRLLEAACLACAAALSLALAVYAVRLVWMSRVTNDISQASDATPLWLPQIAMALGCAGLALAFMDALVSHALHKPFFRAAESARSE
jgi:TRAP-type C4-dicarboxylate transport system permease small subunit